MERYVKCSDCGLVLISEDGECPECGSVYKTVCLGLCDRITAHEQIKGKVKEKGKKKPVKEFVYGDEKRVSNNTWVDKTRIIDREKDEYLEIVKDKETGEIIHKCEEALTNHFGHGTAKKKL